MNIIEINSWDDPRLDAYARLTEAQLRNRLEPERGLFIAESPKVIARALAAGMQPLSFLMERQHLAAARTLIEGCTAEDGSDIPMFTGSTEILSRLTGFELTRGVLCAMRRPALPSVEDLLANARRVAVLEGIVDHTNVGAAFRSAAALGIDAVLVTPTCCDPLYRRSVRVSMGTVFQVPWTRIGQTPDDWPDRGLERLHACGFSTAAMALSDNSVSLSDAALNACERLAIIMGTEGDGLAKRTIAQCDFTVRIPMRHGVDSLNVAAASAVAFYQLCSSSNSSGK
ncbi:TrmH family RNA methyltransferase [Cryptobacterium curtum]